MQPSVENMLDKDQKGDAISVEMDAAKLDAIIAEKDAATSPGSPDQSSSDGLDFGSDTLSDVVTNTASDTSMGTLCV